MSESKNTEGKNGNGEEKNPSEIQPESNEVEAKSEDSSASEDPSTDETTESPVEQPSPKPATATSRAISDIEALEEIREQQRLWRYGTYIGGLIFLVLVLVIIFKVKSFIPPTTDPKQLVKETKTLLVKKDYVGKNNWEKLVISLKKGWEKDLQTDLNNILHNTTNTIAQDLIKPWTNLNARSAEVVKAANDQLSLLEGTMPQATETVLRERLERVIRLREKKLKDINPEASKQEIETAVQLLINLGSKHAQAISDELFVDQLVQLDKIFKDMETIHQTERTGAKGEVPNWEMALMVLDILREEVRPLQTSSSISPTKSPHHPIKPPTVPNSSIPSPPPANPKDSK